MQQDRIGQQFGSYRLVSLMGQGGFADVYLAQHLYLERQAAIKILQARLSQQNQEAFLKEARTIADLVHPNIIRVLDFGVEPNENIPFLVMEYAPQGSLRHRYPLGTRLHLNEVVGYVKQVASALQYAHDRKIVHRDVKPENVLLGQDGSALLSDFGIAVISQTSRPGTQDIHGTVGYMAPEQLHGHPQTASDQYALAMVAYELLCGELPFKGSFAEVGSQQLFATVPPLKEKVPLLPNDIDRIILTALAKDPSQRFASVQAFAHALVQASTSSSTATASSLSNAMTSLTPENPLVPPPPPGFVENVAVPPPPMPSGMFDPTAPGVSGNVGQQMTPPRPSVGSNVNYQAQPLLGSSPNYQTPSPLGSSSGYQAQPPLGSNPNYQSQFPTATGPTYISQGSGTQNSGGPFAPIAGPTPSSGLPQGQQTPFVLPPPNPTPASPSFAGNQTTINTPASQSWNAPNTMTSPPSQNAFMDASRVASPTPPGQRDPQKKSGGHGVYIAIIVALVIIILGGGGFFAYSALTHNSATSAQTASPTAQSATATPYPTVNSTTAGVTPTTTGGGTIPGTNYSALQPGPGCDKNGGAWTPQGINNITCGTQITLTAPTIRGYLFLQLPNNKAIAQNNKVGVIGNPGSDQCVGLDEQDANTGFLVEYCANGHWSIYTISSTDGSIVQTLDKNLTSTRSSVDISMSLKGNTLSLFLDNEEHDVTVTPIQPTKMAITFIGDYSLTVNNFSYTVLS